MGEGEWRSRNAERVREIPDLQLGQATPPSVTPSGTDRQDDSLLQAGDADRQIHPRLRFIITGNREGELCRAGHRDAQHSQNDNHQDVALQVKLINQPKIK
jgi:hypothetical protein